MLSKCYLMGYLKPCNPCKKIKGEIVTCLNSDKPGVSGLPSEFFSLHNTETVLYDCLFSCKNTSFGNTNKHKRLGSVILSGLTFCIGVFVLSMCFCMQSPTTGSALSDCVPLPKSTQVIAQRIPKLPSPCLLLGTRSLNTKTNHFFSSLLHS